MRPMQFTFFVAIAAMVVALPAAAAEAPALYWPLDCRLGEDCWIVHHVDTDPGPGAQDFRCGALTYDGHKGTDIALRDRAAMLGRVPVRAAAAGTVVGTRNTAPDHLGGRADIQTAKDKGQDCGNGIVIAHGDGWITQYCHLKSGSVLVGKGQKVLAGDVLGRVGQSGATQFPHLHLSVRHGKETVDPFSGLAMGAGCGRETGRGLWTADVREMLPEGDAPMLFAAGFASDPPAFASVLQDMRAPETLPVRGGALVLWGVAYGLRAGDRLEFEVKAPDGEVFLSRQFQQEKPQIRGMQFAGRSNKEGILKPGTYQGQVRVIRQATGAPPLIVERRISVELVD